jgi:hypothetical protein
MLRFNVGGDLLHYCCNVDWVTAYATALANVAVRQVRLRQIGAGARHRGSRTVPEIGKDRYVSVASIHRPGVRVVARSGRHQRALRQSEIRARRA